MQFDIAISSTKKSATELMTFLEYAFPEVLQLDAEAAEFLALAISRLRCIADTRDEAISAKH